MISGMIMVSLLSTRSPGNNQEAFWYSQLLKPVAGLIYHGIFDNRSIR